MRKSSRSVFGTLFACTLGGCSGFPATSDIHVDDSNVFVPNVRASLNLTGAKETPSEPRSGHGIEFLALTASGMGSQSISGQPPVVWGGKTFSSPQTLQHDFRFSYYDVSYRWRRFFHGGPVGLEVLAGAAYATLGLTVSSPTQQATETFSSSGLSSGVGLIWLVRLGSSVQARYTFIGASNSLQRVEGFLVQALGRNVSMRAGFVWWKVDAVSAGPQSEILMQFSGPSLGLDLQF